MRRLLLPSLAAALVALAPPAAATTSTTDYTDLWYWPPESGWGVNVVQQGDIVFATFFVYASDGTPHWFVVPEGRSVASSPGQNQFTGMLFQTRGTYYASPWGGPTVNDSVGTATFTFTSPTTGRLTYSVGTQTVNKDIVRQTWRGNNLGGNYLGGLTANGTNCRNGVSNGPILITGDLTIGHSNFFNPTFRVQFENAQRQPGVCTFTGGYAQEGKLGRVTGGNWSCTITGASNPPAGTFTMTQIEANTNGLTARFAGSDQNCTYDGYFGGVRDVL